MLKMKFNSIRLIGVLSLLFTLFYNFAFWRNFLSVFNLTLDNLPFLISFSCFLFLVINLLISIIGHKYIFKLLIIPTLILASFSSYVMDNFNTIITSQTYQNIAETDIHEVHDLLNIRFFLYFIILGLIPSLLIVFSKIDYANWKRKIKFLLLNLLLIIVVIAPFGKHYASFFRNHKVVRYYTNPITLIYSLVKFSKSHFNIQGHRDIQKIGLDAKIKTNGKRKKLIFLIVGETARAKNFSLNGYPRKTNPLLEKQDKVMSFKQYFSCGTETSVSLPCMFSKFSRTDFNVSRGKYFENVLDILKFVNVRIVWRDNNSGCKGLCNRLEVDTSYKSNPKYCNENGCFDELLLDNLQEYISKDYRDTLIVLHMQGNHGPAYYKRYPDNFRAFTPTCDTNLIQNCSQDKIINTYDNIILYTDYFLDQAIKLLEKNTNFDTGLIYVSDHGESLGENGIYLHAMPYLFAPIEQTHIPFITWFSDNFGIDQKSIKSQENLKLSHDTLFHSLLGLFQVTTSEYNKTLDIFNDEGR